MNLCRTCGQDFSSVRAFDKHRVGKHDHGRRCLTPVELEDAGFRLTASGRWEVAADADRARRAFGRTPQGRI